ncbi:MAG: SPFH domain-containing protein [Gemmatimonadales bacterium]|nr:SPFH domain-containing protein [Gemmatimonadales bacterium]
MADMEIQYGAQLTVRPSQLALFVNEGVAADAFGPGRYELTTSTLPVLTNLKSSTFGFESPVVRAADIEAQFRALIIADAAQAFADSGTPPGAPA